MAAKKLRRRIPTDKVSIDRKQWEESKEDQERSDAIITEIGFDIMLAGVIKSTFSRRTEEAEKLMNGINMTQKARLAYILGIIDKTAQRDLEIISKIRNKFGHSFEASFAHTEVLKLVQKLPAAKGKKVTVKNSSKFYASALENCQNQLNEYWAERNPED